MVISAPAGSTSTLAPTVTRVRVAKKFSTDSTMSSLTMGMVTGKRVVAGPKVRLGVTGVKSLGAVREWVDPSIKSIYL